MIIETSNASGLALDWGLAAAMGAGHIWHYEGEVCAQFNFVEYEPYEHADPAVFMGNLASYKIDIRHQHYSSPDRAVLACWGDEGESGYVCAYGSTPAEAVARCIIEMQLGKSFDVPDELVGVTDGGIE